MWPLSSALISPPHIYILIGERIHLHPKPQCLGDPFAIGHVPFPSRWHCIGPLLMRSLVASILRRACRVFLGLSSVCTEWIGGPTFLDGLSSLALAMSVRPPPLRLLGLAGGGPREGHLLPCLRSSANLGASPLPPRSACRVIDLLCSSSAASW
jgi:hypothetical protein